MPASKKTQKKELSKDQLSKAFVMDPKDLPIAQPRTAQGQERSALPAWFTAIPHGAYMSPIKLVHAGIYKSQVSAQVALKRLVQRGQLKYVKRGTYFKPQ